MKTSLIYEPTPKESRRQIREGTILDVAEAVNNLVQVMCSAQDKFWSAEPIQLAEDLNEDLPSALALMAANTALAATANASLDLLKLSRYSKRVPLEIGNPDIAFDGTAFVYTEPPIIEPTPLGDL